MLAVSRLMKTGRARWADRRRTRVGYQHTSGARLETYVIVGERGSVRFASTEQRHTWSTAGEEIIIMGFELSESPITPKLILVDQENRFVRYLRRLGGAGTA